MMIKFSYAIALFAVFTSIWALPSVFHKKDLIASIPENADILELKFQPYMDFDHDSCYQTAAIDYMGTMNPGRKLGGNVDGDCRSPAQLLNSNTYSRRRCNHGFCAILYEYYYEKDQMCNGCSVDILSGHRHDWENVVVFFRQSDQTVIRVAASRHETYSIQTSNFRLKDGTHPYIVYHKEGGLTHCHRFATDYDIASPETWRGRFFRAGLVGWNHWPSNHLRDRMNNADWGRASPKTAERRFADALRRAGSAEVGMNADGADEWDCGASWTAAYCGRRPHIWDGELG